MNNYTIISKLGQGAFSVVYKVKRKQDDEQYAMKKIRIMSLQDKELSNCLNQVRILASLQNPYIVSYKDSFFDELSNTFCIITQLLPGGDLMKLIHEHKINKKLIPEVLIWRYGLQILSALQSLHKISILHRDIKPANVFLSNSSIAKLGDMNVSIVSSNGMAKTQTGTPYYASPQVWNERPYNSKCDIWSLGCVLYEMAAQKPPFCGSDMRSLKKVISAGVYKRIPLAYTSQLNELISFCLKVDPKQRLSAEQLLKLDIVTKKWESMKLIDSSFPETKILQKIQAPKKSNFRIVKDRLPKHRFHSSDKRMDQSLQRDKQNLVNNSLISQSKLTLRKSINGTKKKLSPMKKNITNKQSNDKPPLPKTKILRA